MKEQTEYRVEVMWNREFRFSPYGGFPHKALKSAIKAAGDALDSGDGERVKKVRIVNQRGDVVWPNWEKDVRK